MKLVCTVPIYFPPIAVPKEQATNVHPKYGFLFRVQFWMPRTTSMKLECNGLYISPDRNPKGQANTNIHRKLLDHDCYTHKGIGNSLRFRDRGFTHAGQQNFKELHS